MNLNRRKALGLIAASPLAGSSAFAADLPRVGRGRSPPVAAGDGITGIPVVDDALAQYGLTMANPWVAGCMVAIQVGKIISDAAFQAEVRQRLVDIQRKLEEIDAKVTEILAFTRNYDSIFQRNMNVAEKNRLRIEINSATKIINGAMAKGIRNGRFSKDNLSRADKALLRQKAVEVLQKGYDLHQRGEDAFIAVGQSFLTYAFVCKSIGEYPVTLESAKSETLGYLKQSQPLIVKKAEEQSLAGAIGRHEIERFPRNIFFGGHTGGGSGESRVNYYGTFGGSFEGGFGVSSWDIRSEGLMNQRGWGAFSDQMAGFGQFHPRVGNDDTLKPLAYRAMDVLNNYRARVRNNIDAGNEFRAMQVMNLAMKEIVTPVRA